MATDLTFALQDRPGTLADLAEALGNAGVNIDGIAGFAVAGEGLGHLLVEDASAATKALADAGIEVRGESEVLVVDVPDRPGALGEMARKIADAGVNITFGYLATNTRLVLGVDDIGRARSAI